MKYAMALPLQSSSSINWATYQLLKGKKLEIRLKIWTFQKKIAPTIKRQFIRTKGMIFLIFGSSFM